MSAKNRYLPLVLAAVLVGVLVCQEQKAKHPILRAIAKAGAAFAWYFVTMPIRDEAQPQMAMDHSVLYAASEPQRVGGTIDHGAGW